MSVALKRASYPRIYIVNGSESVYLPFLINFSNRFVVDFGAIGLEMAFANFSLSL